MLTKGVHQLVNDVEDSHPQRNPSIKGQSLELLILGIAKETSLDNFRYHGEKDILYKLLVLFIVATLSSMKLDFHNFIE